MANCNFCTENSRCPGLNDCVHNPSEVFDYSKTLKLTELYYRLVSLDHHKDRDCRWYITQVWSYGEPPVWIVQHYGYCYKKVEWTCDTYEDALEVLESHLTDAIANDVEWAERVIATPSDWDDVDYGNAKRTLEIYNETNK